jgi:aspartate-semialdehyde dehydrogenase
LAKAPIPIKRPTAALVGGDSLLARELRELLQNNAPAPRVFLIAASSEPSNVLKIEDNDAAVLAPLTTESLEGAAVAFLAGTAASSRRALKLSPKRGPAIIDLTGALDDHTGARLRAPTAEPVQPKTSAAVQVIAHPAAIAITMLLSRLAELSPLRASLAHVFEPASERGQQGVEELRKQTVSVLSFKKLAKEVFDTQLAFNLLAAYGKDALEPLDNIEQRVERHLASLLSAWPNLPMPSLRLLQVPVFHGHSISMWVEFDHNPGVEAIVAKLTERGVDVRPDEPPSNANIAGQSGLSVGAVQEDRNNPRAIWIWMVADNLRLMAENAVAVSQELS